MPPSDTSRSDGFISDGFIPPCIATRAEKPPVGRDWVHELKHDGYRLLVQRDGERSAYSRGSPVPTRLAATPSSLGPRAAANRYRSPSNS
jgi:ATP-dependent DNA ligase